jgi:WD40 repeat protein
VIVFNALTGHELRRFLADGRTPEQRKAGRPDSPQLGWVTFSADGRTLVASTGEWLDVWDAETGTMRRRIRQPNPAGCRLALAPDGRTLATSDARFNDDLGRDTIRLIDIATGELILTLEPRDDRASVLAFSPDGNRLLTGFGRGSAVIWDVRRGQAAPKAKE